MSIDQLVKAIKRRVRAGAKDDARTLYHFYVYDLAMNDRGTSVRMGKLHAKGIGYAGYDVVLLDTEEKS